MFKIIFLLFFAFSSLAAELPRLLPPALDKGDLIAIVFPASYSFSEGENQKKMCELFKKEAKWLQKQGYRTVFYPKEVDQYGYLAGTDQQRASALMEAWHNPDVRAIWCGRGGYGSCRILDLIDYDWIRTHPKILIGMSDITVLHAGIQQQTGLVTFLAPVLKFFENKQVRFDQRYALNELQDVVVHEKCGAINFPRMSDLKVLREGRGQGCFVGGNLALIASLCGTKWELDTEGKILVLEDECEDLYRIDRLLWQLKTAGLLEKPTAVVLGSWTGIAKNRCTLSLEQILHHYFGNAPYPVVANFPTGHDQYQTTIPLNTPGLIDTRIMRFELLDRSVIRGP